MKKFNSLQDFKFAPYSFSKVDTYISCPRKFKLSYIDKIKVFKPSPILAKGSFIHTVIEHDIQGTMDEITVGKDFDQMDEGQQADAIAIVETFLEGPLYAEIVDGFKHDDLQEDNISLIEEEFYLDYKLRPASTKAEALLFGKIDFIVASEWDDEGEKYGHVSIYDWKSGGKSKEDLKKFPKKSDQLETYAIWGLQVFNPDEIKTGYVFVEHEHLTPYRFIRNGLRPLQRKLLDKIEKIETEEKFSKNETILCAWCDYIEHCYEGEKLQELLDYRKKKDDEKAKALLEKGA